MSSLPTQIACQTWPDWVPVAARAYLAHAVQGRALRDVARANGCAASTVLRQVRRIEQRRDDPNVDDLFEGLAEACKPFPVVPDQTENKDASPMSALPHRATLVDDETLNHEAKRILRRLCENDAFLAIGQGQAQAVVLRDIGDTPTRTATVPKSVAQAFVLKDWVSCFKAGKITRYRITEAGRAALKRLLSDTLNARQEARGMAESASPFLTQHIEMGTREVPGIGTLRVNLAESPLGGLARKKDRDGKPFLSMDLVAAGERLREDFERAQMGPRLGQNWERFLTAGDRGQIGSGGMASGPTDARERVSLALRELGPGLADVVLRVCCFLEGMEAAEKRLGWAARSGKIVLRIALQRLAAHYERLHH